jgi:ankyrin repeat protein
VGVLNYLLDETELAMDETNDFGQSPLHRACFGGHYDCCCALVDKGAYFGLTDSESRNALHHAAATGSHKICHFLCSVCKMSVFTEDNEGCTAIDYALNNGYRELASQLAKKGFVQLRCDKLVRGVQLFTPTFAQLSSSVGRS